MPFTGLVHCHVGPVQCRGHILITNIESTNALNTYGLTSYWYVSQSRDLLIDEYRSERCLAFFGCFKLYESFMMFWGIETPFMKWLDSHLLLHCVRNKNMKKCSVLTAVQIKILSANVLHIWHKHFNDVCSANKFVNPL